MLFRALFLVTLILPGSLLAQGPIFLTPPNTMPVSTVSPAASYVRKGAETDLVLQGQYGIRPDFTVGLGATMITDEGGPLQLGRLQTQAKLRLHERKGDGKRTVVGLSGNWAVPMGATVSRVAKENGVTLISSSITASHVNRRAGWFAGVLVTGDAHFEGTRFTNTTGIAASWRPVPAPPGATGGPGFTLFGEVLGHYEANHSGWVALAPGVIFRAGRTQLKLGLRAPIRRWNSTSSPMLSLGTSMFIPTTSGRP